MRAPRRQQSACGHAVRNRIARCSGREVGRLFGNTSVLDVHTIQYEAQHWIRKVLYSTRCTGEGEDRTVTVQLLFGTFCPTSVLALPSSLPVRQ
jgi:hypothetical protein